MQSVTISERIKNVGGHSTGFDYLRISLAFGVVGYHSAITTYGQAAQDKLVLGPLHSFIALILPSFFALSGFLVAGSLERSKNIVHFLSLRILRIFPALSAEVLLSALLVGPAVTSYALRDYFSDSLFFRYFFNIIGHVQFKLPGAFETNPLPLIVNGQLWTVPFELECYAALTAVALVGIVKKRALLLFIVAFLQAAFVVKNIISPPTLIRVHSVLSGNQLTMTFFYGVIIYQFRDKLIWSKWAFLASTLLSLALLWPQSSAMDYLSLPFIAYLTVYLGLTNPPKTLIVKIGDLSYGVFLYSFTIQQLGVYVGVREWWTNLLFAVPLCLLFALFSWTCVEKPFLGLRHHVSKLDPLMDWLSPLARFRNVIFEKAQSLTKRA
jgi:peptidoglycan/LPS O-acetylase OafA/YrhL